MEFTCEQIGLTPDELQERVVDGIIHKAMNAYVMDENGELVHTVQSRLNDALRGKITDAIDRAAEKYLSGKIEALIEGQVLQKTNEWGEKRGVPVSFIEYLVKRADEYMREKVDFQGNSRAEQGYGSSFKAANTRISYHVEKHLQYSLDQAMKQVVKGGNKTLADALTEAVRIRIGEVVSKTKVEVTTR